MNKEQFNEFQDLAKPLVKYLRENFNPHTVIVVADDRADVFEGVMGAPFHFEDDTTPIKDLPPL